MVEYFSEEPWTCLTCVYLIIIPTNKQLAIIVVLSQRVSDADFMILIYTLFTALQVFVYQIRALCASHTPVKLLPPTCYVAPPAASISRPFFPGASPMLFAAAALSSTLASQAMHNMDPTIPVDLFPIPVNVRL